MAQCKECGSELPVDARFCLQCGAPVKIPFSDVPQEPERPVPPAPELDFVQPALAGGVFLGVLSTLPLVSLANCLCCMWVVGGGAVAANLLSKQRPGGITYGDGAFVGVLSGVFGSFVATLLSIPIKLISARFFGSQQEALDDMFRNLPELEGPFRDMITRIASSEVSVMSVIITLIANLLFYCLFAMLGGILFLAIMNKRGGPIIRTTR